MPAIVNSIESNSIAEELDIQPGDEIVSIDSQKPQDLLDYKFLISSEIIDLHIKRTSGEEEIIEIEKDSEEDLGITFESAVFDKIIPCTNKCIFCFVDQQPTGLRESLYFKDDDYRLSYLQGTYITLTNLNAKSKKRIEALRLGPLYVSVHTTNPELRVKMLKNPKAGNILKELEWLKSLDIPVHTQIVVCPEINDEEELEKTLSDLSSFENVHSIAIVPVGITRYRPENELQSFTAEKAKRLIEQVKKYKLAYPSDEFYVLAEDDFPENKFYNGFSQLEDGVGAARMLLDDYNLHKHKLPKQMSKPFSFSIAAGQIACKVFKPIIEDLNKIKNLKVEIIPIKSNFWGKNVTVSGLVTGSDLLENIMPVKDQIQNLLIPSVMLRKYTDRFLDDIRLSDIEKKLGINIVVIENYYSTEEIIDFIKDN